MKLTFTCPTSGRMFDTDAYRVVEDRGVVTDPAGGRTWNAAVALSRPCPHCGDHHRWSVSELACPFGGGGN